MRIAIALLFACAVAAACTTPAQPTPPTDAPHPSDTCILLEQSKNAELNGQLSDAQRELLRGIQTETLPRPIYQCGDASYQTDPSQRGLTFTGVGFTANHRNAAVALQAVSGPLAGAGYRCLYEAADQSWTLIGCQMEWIS